jgi:hypothetical protein
MVDENSESDSVPKGRYSSVLDKDLNKWCTIARLACCREHAPPLSSLPLNKTRGMRY